MIRPAGFGAEGFDESKILGAKNLREQVDHHLKSQNIDVQAHEMVEKAAKEALEIENPAERQKFLQDAQLKVDHLFDLSGARSVLPRGEEGNQFYAKLKGEWSEKYNVQQRADTLADEAEKAKLPKPEEISRTTRSAPPPPTLGAEDTSPAAPTSGTGGGADDFAEIFRKLMEELQRQGGGGAATTTSRPAMRGSGLSPEVRETVLQWHKELDSGKKQLLFEKLKAALGGTSKEAQSKAHEENLPDLLGQIEAAGPKPKAAPTPPSPFSLFGADSSAPTAPATPSAPLEAPAPVEAPAPPTLQAGAPPAPPSPLNLIAQIRSAIVARWDAGWPLRIEFLKKLDSLSPTLSTDGQIQELRKWADSVIANNPSWYSTANAQDKRVFQAFTFATKADFDTRDFSDFVDYIAHWTCWASPSQQSRIDMVKSMFSGNFFVNMLDMIRTGKTLNDFKPQLMTNFFNTDAFGIKIDNRFDPYVKFPGLTFNDLKMLWGDVRLPSNPPICTPLDTQYALAYNSWMSASGPDKELFRNLKEGIYDLIVNQKLVTVDKLVDWAKTKWNPLATFIANASASGIATFMQITNYYPLPDLRKMIEKWGSTAPEIALRNDILKAIDSLGPLKSIVDLRNLLNQKYFGAGKEIYFMFPGLKNGPFLDNICKLLGINNSTMPVPSDPANKLWEIMAWRDSGSLSPTEKALADWLFNQMFQNGDSKTGVPRFGQDKGLVEFGKWVATQWKWGALPTALQNASAAEMMKFVKITGFQPYDYFKAAINSWQTSSKLKMDLLGLLESNKTNIPKFYTDLQNLFTSGRFYINYVSVPSSDLDKLCAILKVPKPIPNKTETVFMQAFEAYATTFSLDAKKLFALLWQRIYDDPTINDQNLADKLNAFWKTTIQPVFWQAFPDLTFDDAQLFGKITGIKVDPTRAQVQNAIKQWANNGGPAEKALSIEFLKAINASNFTAFATTINQNFLDPSKHIYSQAAYFGLTFASLSSLCSALNLTAPKATKAEDLLATAFNYANRPDATGGCKKLFVDWLVTLLQKNNTVDTNASLQDLLSKNWTHKDDFWTFFAGVTDSEAIYFQQITHLPLVNSLTQLRELIKNWGKSAPEIALRNDILTILDGLIKDKGKTIDDLRSALNARYFSAGKDIFFMFPGLRDGADHLDQICGILGLKPNPPSDLDKKLMDIWQWTQPGNPDKPLADWLFSQMFQDPKETDPTKIVAKFANMKAFTDWAATIWDGPQFKDALQGASTAGRLQFIAFTGYQPLAQVLKDINAFKPDSEFKNAIINSLNAAFAAGKSLDELRALLNKDLFTSNMYFKFPGLDKSYADGINNIIKGLNVKTPDDLDMAFKAVVNWKGTGPDKNLAIALYNLMRDGDGNPKFANFADFQKAIRNMWTTETLPPEFKSASDAGRILFMNITDIKPLEEIKYAISQWMKPGAETDFANALLKALNALRPGASPSEMRAVLTGFFQNHVYASYPGLTPDRLQVLLNTPFITPMTRPDPNAMETILLKILNYQTTTASGASLFAQLLDQIKAHPAWSVDELGTNWWSITSKDFWNNFKGLSEKEIADFQVFTGLTIPAKPGQPVEPAEKTIRDYIDKLNALWARLQTRIGRFGDLNKLAQNQWDAVWRAIGNFDLTRYGFTPQESDMLKNFFRPPHSTQNSILKFYTDALAEIDVLKKKVPPGNLNDLIDWINKNPGYSDKDKADLINMIKPKS